MGLFDLPILCALLLFGHLGAEASASPQIAELPSGRVLRAATKRSDLFRRDTRISRRFDASLSFIESENGFQNHEIFASEVRVKSEVPILSLEDHEHHLNDVWCSDQSIKLDFVSPISARDALHACKHENGGYIITSHSSCNKEGERAVYRVHDVSLSKDTSSLEIAVEKVSWGKAFRSTKVDFSYTTEGHLLRRHSDFQRRQVSRSTSTSSVKPSSKAGSASTKTVSTVTSLSSPSGSSRPDSSSVQFNLTQSFVNTTFANPAPLIQIPNLASAIPLTIGCRNCSTTGFIKLTAGSFDLEVPDIFGNTTAFDIIKSGFLELSADNLGAHIELVSTPTVSSEFKVQLFELPVGPVGFTIPGIGSAGVRFVGEILTSYKVTGGVEFTYGFELNVPSGSKFRVDLGDWKNSGATGFKDTRLTALPFTANITDVELEVSAGFRPRFPVGFEVKDILSADVDVFLDLPKLQAKLGTNLTPVDASCNSPNNTIITPSPTPTPPPSTAVAVPASVSASLLSSIGPLLHISPAYMFALGVGADFSAILVPIQPLTTDLTLVSTVFALPTACLAPKEGFKPAQGLFDAGVKSYVDEEIKKAQATAKAGAGNKSVHGAAAGRFGFGVGKGLEGWAICGMALGVVAGGMVLL